MPHEPKKKHSKAQKRTRRSAIKLAEIGLIVCSNCQKPTIPHQVCQSCGFFKGKQVIQIAKVTKA